MREVITSAKNPKIKYLQSLRQKKYRDEEEKYLIEGLRIVEEAVNSRAEIEEFIVDPEYLDNQPALQQLLNETDNLTFVNEQLFKKFTSTETPQGIVALVKKPLEEADNLFEVENPFVLIIDKVQDPGNLGTIIRTADAAGANGVMIVQGTVDLHNPKTLRSTMGSIFHLPIVFVETVSEACAKVKERGFKVLATSLEDGAVSYYKTDLSGPVALVVGNEARGVSEEALEVADQLITIDMPGLAESLNVAVAMGVIMFEIVRQRLSAKGDTTCKSQAHMV